MAKRKLSKQQARRVAQQHKERAARASDTRAIDEDEHLGPEEPGLVIAQFGKQVDVEGESGSVKRCFLRANLGSIVTGDQVIWRDGKREGVVVSRLPRRSELARPDSFGKMKPVAANIDEMVVTLAPRPQAHANLIDRYLVVAETLDLTPILLLNKADICDSEPDVCSTLTPLLNDYRKLGYRVLRLSAHTGAGLDELRQLLRDNTSVFVGQSGAGKSSIIQKLLPGETIKIGQLSEQVHKGRHTTTHSRLYHFPDGGHCVDSPGIREFGLWHMDAEQVAAGFREFRPYLGSCRFRDCRHRGDPGCALAQALAQGRISHGRFDSYMRIVDSLDAVDIKDS